jgi:hypothetical protein
VQSAFLTNRERAALAYRRAAALTAAVGERFVTAVVMDGRFALFLSRT